MMGFCSPPELIQAIDDDSWTNNKPASAADPRAHDARAARLTDRDPIVWSDRRCRRMVSLHLFRVVARNALHRGQSKCSKSRQRSEYAPSRNPPGSLDALFSARRFLDWTCPTSIRRPARIRGTRCSIARRARTATTTLVLRRQEGRRREYSQRHRHWDRHCLPRASKERATHRAGLRASRRPSRYASRLSNCCWC